MKTGILGGTFNPIHNAHLRIAEEVRDTFALDRVLFIPAATPPHKPQVGELTFSDRLEMVRLAIPRRVYTNMQITYVAESIAELYQRRDMVAGLSMVYEAPVLRHFTARFEELQPSPC